MMKEAMLVCCKLYISETRNLLALQQIEGAAKMFNPETLIVNKWEDPMYNRVRYTLVSYMRRNSSSSSASYSYSSPLGEAVVAMVEAAYAAINLEFHSGAHPRLGVVDHICFHPMPRTSLQAAAHFAKLVAAHIGNAFQVPVFLYGAAHTNGKELDAIRRDLGYFQPNYMGNQWSGWGLPEILPEKPDEGPAQVTRAKGIVVIGASPWFDTYNVALLSSDVAAARRIARLLSARGGGLPGVQALGLVHGEDTIEIACMILEPKWVGEDRLRQRVEILAAEEGLEVENGYFRDFSQEMIAEKYEKLASEYQNKNEK